MKDFGTQITQILNRVDETSPTSIQEAASMALGLGGITSNCEVAIIDDPTQPTAGLKGKVKSVEGGIAQVELPNGMVVGLMVNQLMRL